LSPATARTKECNTYVSDSRRLSPQSIHFKALRILIREIDSTKIRQIDRQLYTPN
jgi:hypothetical protein